MSSRARITSRITANYTMQQQVKGHIWFDSTNLALPRRAGTGPVGTTVRLGVLAVGGRSVGRSCGGRRSGRGEGSGRGEHEDHREHGGFGEHGRREECGEPGEPGEPEERAERRTRRITKSAAGTESGTESTARTTGAESTGHGRGATAVGTTANTSKPTNTGECGERSEPRRGAPGKSGDLGEPVDPGPGTQCAHGGRRPQPARGLPHSAAVGPLRPLT